MYPNKGHNQKGFTLLETMSVIVILGVLASVTVHRYEQASDAAERQSLSIGIRELNIRETMTWARLKISTGGWPDDDHVFDSVEKNLGRDYFWEPNPPAKAGGRLRFKSTFASLSRIPSTIRSPAVWE